jgi:AcrR family transcriptional regulator
MTSIRTQQRETTQRKILQTARKLFLASSFDSVGVREIAAEAGVATGTVIAAFGSKVDLLHAIVIEDLNEQLVLMKVAAASFDQTFDRILKLCEACIAHQSNRLAIVRASMADSWLRSDEAENKIRKAIKPLHQVVVDELLRGIERGEIRADLHVKLGANLILESLLNTYRLPLYDDVANADLGKMLRERLDILMRGYAKASGQSNDNLLVVESRKEFAS